MGCCSNCWYFEWTNCRKFIGYCDIRNDEIVAECPGCELFKPKYNPIEEPKDAFGDKEECEE